MGVHGIDIVTVIIGSIVLWFVIKGIRNEFSSEDMFRSVNRDIDSVLFLSCLIVSFHFTSRVIFGPNENGIYRIIYDMIPERVIAYLGNMGILLYFTAVPVVLAVMFFLLRLVVSLFDGLLKRISEYTCRFAKKCGRGSRGILGIILELPKAAAVVFVVILLVSLLNTYYPVNPLAAAVGRSRTYDYLYSRAVLPLMDSSLGQHIPAFMWNSIEGISRGIEKSSLINKDGKLETLGLLRFQYESRSNMDIDEMARQITAGSSDEREKSYRIYKWIGDNIEYDWDKYDNIINGTSGKDKFGAIQAFNTGEGVCEDYADLYVAMARAAGLKVRIVVGQGYSNGTWGGHAWNQVYITEEKEWIPLDATWADSGNYFDSRDFYDTHVFEAVAAEW